MKGKMETAPILGPLDKLKPCKHGVRGLCVKCRYQNTGRRKSTDDFVEKDVCEFMEASINKRLKEIETNGRR